MDDKIKQNDVPVLIGSELRAETRIGDSQNSIRFTEDHSNVGLYEPIETLAARQKERDKQFALYKSILEGDV